mgnify:CR=1 FL=1
MDGLRRWGRRLVDAVLPPLCLSCGAIVAEPGTLCSACWSALRFLSTPWCDCCGHPFEIDPGGGAALCGRCLATPPPWGRARAVLRYDDASKPLFLRFKHADRLEGAPAFGRWMARAGAELLAECDLIVPVPLHRWRLLARRYNQAALLALAVGRDSGRPVCPDGLRRVRRTPPQGHFGRAERAGNVKGAFALAPHLEVTGRRIVLVDDVLTSGATAGECARLLGHHGAVRVDVLTLGRALLSDG